VNILSGKKMMNQRMMRDYVGEAAEAYFHRDGKVQEVGMMYEEAMERFPMIHILIGMAHTETLKAVDMMDDMGLRRHQVKRHLAEYEKRHDTYVAFMHRHMTADAWALIQDYICASCNKAEYRCVMLRQACYNYLKKKGVKNDRLLAQCEVGFLLWNVATETFSLYFDTYKKACGVDFRKEFGYADMSKCQHEWGCVLSELVKGIGGIDFNDDRRCRDAWEALKAEINNTEFFDAAAGDAIRLNPEIMERHKGTEG